MAVIRKSWNDLGAWALACDIYKFNAAQKYADSLLDRAVVAFAEGDTARALNFARKEADFTARTFGQRYALTKCAVECVRALEMYARCAEQNPPVTISLVACKRAA